MKGRVLCGLMLTVLGTVIGVCPVATAQPRPPTDLDIVDVDDIDAEAEAETEDGEPRETTRPGLKTDPYVVPDDDELGAEQPLGGALDEEDELRPFEPPPDSGGSDPAEQTIGGEPRDAQADLRQPDDPTPGNVEIPPPPERPRPLKLRAPVKRVDVVTEQQLRAQVEKMVEAYRSGDAARFTLARTELEALQARAGVRNVVLASAMLIRQAQVASEAGVHPRAVALAEASVRLSPDLPAAHWTLVQTLWGADWTQLRRVGGAFAGLVGAELGAFRNQVAVLTTLLGILGLAALCTIFVFALVQVIKYVRYPAHDLAERLPAFIGGGEMVIVLGLVVVLPMAFGAGPAVAALVGLVIAAGYQLPTERRWSQAMMGSLALVPLALVAFAPLMMFHGSLVDDMATATSEAFASKAEARLQAAAKGQERDNISDLILAQRKRRRGDLRGADIAYERALVTHPGDPIALNNRGVVQYLLGHPEAAISLFRKGASKGVAESALNLAAIRADAGKFEEATKLLEQARSIAPSLAADYTAFHESGDAKFRLLEADIETSALWARLLDVEWGASWGVAESLWRRLAGATPLWTLSLAAALALALSVLLGARSERLSTDCPKCGQPADRQTYGKLCDQCTSVFLVAVAVDPELRARKESEVRGYQRRRRWVERGTAVIAGLGDLTSGRPGPGVVMFFLLSVALLSWALRWGLWTHDWMVAPDPAAAAAVGTLALVAAAVLCAISVRQSMIER